MTSSAPHAPTVPTALRFQNVDYVPDPDRSALLKRFRPEHSVVGRLRILTRVFLRHRQYWWWAVWRFFGPVQFLLDQIAQRLDVLFYPKVASVEVDRPVFVIAHPRSGTTFMQRRLHETDDACMFRTWELFFPTLTYRAIGRPIMSVLRLLNQRTLIGPESGHEVGLDSIEEDEAIFLHRLDSDILSFFCPHVLIDPDVSDFWLHTGSYSRIERRRSVDYFNMAVRRQLAFTGKQRVVSKFAPSVYRIRELLETFPDARFVYLIRDPAAAIRSFLSLRDGHTAPLLSPEERRVFLRNTYQWCVNIYLAFEKNKHLIPSEQLLVLPFKELTENVAETMQRVIEFTGLHTTAEYWRQQEQRDRSTYRRPHANEPLEYYGVSPEEVRQDLAIIYEEYGLE